MAPRKIPPFRRRLLRLLLPENTAATFRVTDPPKARLKHAKKMRLIERRPSGKGIGKYRLSPAGKFEYYNQHGSEKSWSQLNQLQRNRLARVIIRGFIDYYTVHVPFKGIRISKLNPRAYTFEGMFVVMIDLMKAHYRETLKHYTGQKRPRREGDISLDEVRRLRNGIGIFQHILGEFRRGNYHFEH